VQLEVEIEKEKEAEVEAAAAMKVDSAAQNGDGSEEQTVSGSNASSSEVNGVVKSEMVAGTVHGDVKMEGQ
jgi:hypothetical protein